MHNVVAIHKIAEQNMDQ